MIKIIPKIIHYCWFGNGELPKLEKACIESWKKYCPDYEIKLWNEKNFDYNALPYTKQAYEVKKFAFVSDVARLQALYEFGGIYLDTDVEMFKPIEEFLTNNGFFGFEADDYIGTAVIGAKKNHEFIKTCLDYYANRQFIKSDGSYDYTSNVQILTSILTENGLNLNNTAQDIRDFNIYPKDYFYPMDYYSRKKIITSNTHTIHHYSGSWFNMSKKMKKFFRSIVGADTWLKIKQKMGRGGQQ